MSFLRLVAAVTATASLGVLALPARAQVDLSMMGVQAPTLNIGTDSVTAGTLQYSNSGGSSDAFSVGTSTSINASASASSTPDYSVNSKSNFGVDSSVINQVIGTSGSTNNTRSNSMGVDVESSAAASAESAVSREYKQEGGGYYWWRNNQWEATTEQEYTSARSSSYDSAYSRAYENINSSLSDSGTISGSFQKVGSDSLNNSNDVTVKGIGANNTVNAATGSAFTTDIIKSAPADGSSSGSAGTASGSAAGNVSTTASANANSTQFVSSFVQAY